jgi:hypothetical protein
MLKSTIHVPTRRHRLSSKDRTLFATLAVPRRGMLFPDVSGAKRQYPGEKEGAYLAEHLNGLKNDEQTALLRLLGPLWSMERAIQGLPFDPFERREVMRAHARLKQQIDRGGLARISVDGLVIPPTSPTGKAALAALLLNGKLHLCRLRQCIHCSKWFYARVERKKFCSTKCQENHGHSPEWRKRNRERNREHQRAYRQRNPGRRTIPTEEGTTL